MPRFSAFLSYSRQDSALVEKMKRALEERELSYWLDTAEVKGGDVWEAVIRRALTQSDTLLVFVTQNILGSFVETEVGLAEDLRKPLIPLVFDDVIEGDAEIIARLRRYHFIDFRRKPDLALEDATGAVARAYLAPVLSTYNVKGGVGKTTITMNLGAYYFKQKHKRVLLIDFDPQTNLSTMLVLSRIERKKGGLFGMGGTRSRVDILPSLQQTKKSVLGVLEEAMRIADQADADFDLSRFSYTIDGSNPGAVFDIVAGDTMLRRLATEASQAQAAKAKRGFARFVGQCRKEYDCVLVDMNPSISILSKCALAATTHILSPVKPDMYSMQGLNLLDDISSENDVEARGCEQMILINDPREDREGIVRGRIAQSAFRDRLLGPDLVYSRHFVAKPGSSVNRSLNFLPAYGSWGESPNSARRALRAVADEVAQKIGLHV
jgi:chromosome partitioning protein